MIWGYPHLGNLHILPVDTSWPQEIKHLLSDSSEVTALQFSPAGNWLAVGHRDGQVQVFWLKLVKLSSLIRLTPGEGDGEGERIRLNAPSPKRRAALLDTCFFGLSGLLSMISCWLCFQCFVLKLCFFLQLMLCGFLQEDPQNPPRSFSIGNRGLSYNNRYSPVN